ncbi:MAG: PEGA domain-containing protein, partial [Verrucomicrobiota bacterium]
VGTEGYVPPEGPGTSSADLFALSMVLYEMHTGKSRIDFPELPTNHEIAPTVNRDDWRELNTVICRGGSPDPRKRFENGSDFSRALSGIKDRSAAIGKKAPSQGLGFMGKMLIGAAIIGLVVVIGGIGFLFKEFANPSTVDPNRQPLTAEDLEITTPIKDIAALPAPPEPDQPIPDVPEQTQVDPTPKDPVPPAPVDPPPPKPTTSSFTVTSLPSGASVWMDGEEIGITPTPVIEAAIGEHTITLRMDGYHDWETDLSLGTRKVAIDGSLLRDHRPIKGSDWVNSQGMKFQDGPVFLAGVNRANYEEYLTANAQEARAIAVSGGVVQVKDDQARWDFCDWLTRTDRAQGFLDKNQYYHPFSPDDGRPKNSLFVMIEDRRGTLLINSNPAGAQVFHGDEIIGTTPKTVHTRFGPYAYRLSKPGFVDISLTGEVIAEDPVPAMVNLQEDGSVKFSEAFENCIGIKMVP